MTSESSTDFVRGQLAERSRFITDLAECAESIAAAGEAIAAALRRGRRVLTFGNGGSAADAQHFATELVGRYSGERRAWPSMALCADSAVLTALANDYGYEEVFARQVVAAGRLGDVAVGISTSGRSPNVIKALESARRHGLQPILLTGANAPGDGADVLVVSVPSTRTAVVQEMHAVVVHVWCQMLDEFHAPHDAVVSKHRSVEALLEERHQWRLDQRTVVWTSEPFGTIDAHAVRFFEWARQQGDVLVVGVGQLDSERVIEALEVVDRIVGLDPLAAERALAELEPDVVCIAPGSGTAPVTIGAAELREWPGVDG